MVKNENISIRKWVAKFDAGEFDSKDLAVQCKAGWYDWFCRNTSLAAKTKKLGRYLKQILGSKKINVETSYVFFKNNCPMYGSLYDDFRICDLETGDVIYTIVPKSGHKSMNGKGEIWGRENQFHEALVTGSWKEIKQWFKEG